MNYFELYELPMQCSIDKSMLKRKYYQLSKKYHPDFFDSSLGNLEAENLAIAAKVNEAYTLFQHTQHTLAYILQQKNSIKIDEKYQLPSSFLMEVMELNETMNENSNDAINVLLRDIEKPVVHLLQLQDMESLDEDDLVLLKDYYYKWKYLDRLQQRANGVEEFE